MVRSSYLSGRGGVAGTSQALNGHRGIPLLVPQVGSPPVAAGAF